MNAKFLSKKDMIKQRENALRHAEEAVEARYATKLTKGMGIAFLRACMRIWGCGAVTAVSRLNSELSEQFIYGWLHRDIVAGCLVKMGLEPGEQVPIFVQSKSLAYSLDKTPYSYWVDYNEVEKEYNRENR